MIYKDRMTATMDGDCVVFMIGMRINSLWKIHLWIPVFAAMARMLKELYNNPEIGLIHHEMWFSRTIIVVQYWRSMDQLLAYSKNKDSQHLPAWRAFNRAVGLGGSVGIWHETYSLSPGHYENVYVNMPAFGMGKAGRLEPARGCRASAAGRLEVPHSEDVQSL